MLNILFILIGKLVSKIFRSLNLGNGSTWPGHIALNINKHFIKDVFKNSKTQIIIVAGTNGKTTTSTLIETVLKESGKKVFRNQSGANLLNGIASAIILNGSLTGSLTQDFAIFEIDENTLPLILKEISPDYVILLNLFRDQLDRYGEVNIVASYWTDAIKKLTDQTTLILNADDPQIGFMAKNSNAKNLFFGLNESSGKSETSKYAADSDYCPQCSEKLTYNQIIFSHLGDWYCENCGLTRPKLNLNNFSIFPLPGIYNKYNSLASILALREIGITDGQIEKSFTNFKPAFGRQEIVKYKNKNVQIFLSKNPTSFNQSIQTILELGAKTLLIVLNDRIPDGRDVSWIWDIELLGIKEFKNILISGDRVYDMALRLKYEDYKNFKTYEILQDAINAGVGLIDQDETLYILPTYSAMLEVRKIITGKKIL